ncbi:hypothetical protein J6590_039106 [Homalodisca vitripennis]|nr:hypothetical protein J6590_039106 [Homalodisca vitripennis]
MALPSTEDFAILECSQLAILRYNVFIPNCTLAPALRATTVWKTANTLAFAISGPKPRRPKPNSSQVALVGVVPTCRREIL